MYRSRKNKTLSLQRETVRTLASSELRGAQGGTQWTGGVIVITDELCPEIPLRPINNTSWPVGNCEGGPRIDIVNPIP